jgi:hypothetical protein
MISCVAHHAGAGVGRWPFPASRRAAWRRSVSSRSTMRPRVKRVSTVCRAVWARRQPRAGSAWSRQMAGAAGGGRRRHARQWRSPVRSGRCRRPSGRRRHRPRRRVRGRARGGSGGWRSTARRWAGVRRRACTDPRQLRRDGSGHVRWIRSVTDDGGSNGARGAGPTSGRPPRGARRPPSGGVQLYSATGFILKTASLCIPHYFCNRLHSAAGVTLQPAPHYQLMAAAPG